MLFVGGSEDGNKGSRATCCFRPAHSDQPKVKLTVGTTAEIPKKATFIMKSQSHKFGESHDMLGVPEGALLG